MEMLIYGHAGFPVLVFPTSQGRFFEYENAGMIDAIWRKMEGGELQLFCIDSFDSQSWYDRRIHPHHRVQGQIAYENYILYEVLPLINGLNGASQICTTGCSLGGYHALNFALRHPDVTCASVVMSGAFDMKRFMDGYYDSDFYFNNPVDYLSNMSDPWFLHRYQQMRLVLAAGDFDICLGETVRMAHILEAKGIPRWLDVWTGGEYHDWPLWRRMAVKFF